MGEQARVTNKKPEIKSGRSDSRTRQAGLSHSMDPNIESILYLQRTIGNQAVQGLIKSGALQPKLKISQPDDKYEQEAELVADTMMRMPDPQLQRQPDEGEKEEELIQTKALNKNPYENSDLQKQLTQSKGEENSLPEDSRASMESRFGTDFSDVRIHTGQQAAEMSRAINAQAFTSGRDIYFGADRYNPGTNSGDRLLAHELTHVVQQRSLPADHGISRSSQLKTDNNDTIYRQAASTKKEKTPSKPEEETAPGVMELKGMTNFEPPKPISDYLDEKKTGKVNVSFGTMAEGAIKVTKRSSGKYKAKNQYIPINHPVFSKIGEAEAKFQPGLVLTVKEDAISGYIGFGKKRGNQALASQLKKAPDIVGLTGFNLKKLPKITNKLEVGNLHLGLKGVPITLGNAFSGNINLEAINEYITFEGNADISVKGLASGNLELNRSKEGLITGKAAVESQLSKNISGNVIIFWNGEIVTGEGKVSYIGEKLSGVVTLKLMEKSKAEQLVEGKKAPTGEAVVKKPEKKKSKASKVDYAVFGEGDLTFAFNEWLTGTAHVIVDQEGFLTVIGKITPQKEVELFPQKDYNKKLFKAEARASYGIPVVGNIFIFANVGMDAFAKMGPGKLYNISVEGTYSTDPKKEQNFTIQGSLNISAAAGLKLRGEAGAGLEILAHDIKAGAGVNGIAGIKGYAEATPIIGYREKAREGEDKKGEFFIRGEMEIAAQPFLGLSGDLFVEVDSPWISPLPDKRWTWPLVDKEWPIGSNMGIKASVDYVFGSKEYPTIEFEPVEFSADKFMTDLYNDKAKKKSGGPGEQKGKWKEKNSKSAMPPAAPGKKGDVKEGEPPKLGPAKPTVKPGGPKKAKKKMAPGAKTVEGKSVKKLEEEASKKGKKPEAKGLKKEAGKTEVAVKNTEKESHDKKLQEGLAALAAVNKRYVEKGATKEELEVAVKAVRRKFKVFKSITIVDGGKTWDYEYVASKAKKKTGVKKSKEGKLTQEKLDKLAKRKDPVYNSRSLGRPRGPSGHVIGVKSKEEREDLPSRKELLPSNIDPDIADLVYHPKDHRGHLIGDRFNGPAKNTNIVPMHKDLNLSTFKKFENEAAAEYKEAKKPIDKNDKKGKEKPALLHMEIVPNYSKHDKTDPGSYRPESVTAKGKIITLEEKNGNIKTKTEKLKRSDTFTNTQTCPSGKKIVYLNTAEKKDIAKLPGVGQKIAAEIVERRIFASYEALKKAVPDLDIEKLTSDPCRPVRLWKRKSK